MKKAVAIPYVIALILGVIVVGILGYWFVSQGGKTIGVGINAECDAKYSQFCQAWRNNKFGTEPLGFDWSGSCTSPDKPKCAEVLGCTYGGGCSEDLICYYNGEICPSPSKPDCPFGTVHCPK